MPPFPPPQYFKLQSIPAYIFTITAKGGGTLTSLPFTPLLKGKPFAYIGLLFVSIYMGATIAICIESVAERGQPSVVHIATRGFYELLVHTENCPRKHPKMGKSVSVSDKHRGVNCPSSLNQASNFPARI